jgi:hypothetical protein
VVEYGYPSGHLGHLNEEEENALKNFKALCLEKGVYKPGGEGEAPSHDDPTLLYVIFLPRTVVKLLTSSRRYLRARRFVPADAYSQFKDTEDWRKANQLEALYETIDLEHFEETRRLVCLCPAYHITSMILKYMHSTHNGPVDETSAVFQYMSTKLNISTRKR